MLIEVIGEAAMLEQTAEECVELAHACLKMARELRGENKTHKDKNDIYNNLCEEVADVRICIEELSVGDVINETDVHYHDTYKRIRMVNRLDEDGALTD